MNRHQIFGGLLLVLALTAQVSAQEEGMPEIQELEQFEEMEPQKTEPTTLELIGRFHPMLVHFPIAWLILLSLGEIYNLLNRQIFLWKPILYIHVLAMLSFIPAAVTGFILAAHSGTDADFLLLMTTHRNLNIAGGGLCLISLAVRVKAGLDLRGIIRITVVLLILLATATVLIASHYGGEMVWGKSFFPF